MKHLRKVRNATLLAALGLIGLGALDDVIPRFAAHTAPVNLAFADDAQTTSELTRAYGAWWQVGDKWTVETVASTDEPVSSAKLASGKPVRWQFTVVEKENRKGVDYYRATAKCVSKGVVNAPTLTIWVNAQTSRLASVSATLNVDEKQTIKIAENYPDNRAVITSFTAIPLEVLAFADKDFSVASKGVGDSDSAYIKTERVERGSVRLGDFNDGDAAFQKSIDAKTPMDFGYSVKIEVTAIHSTSRDISGPDECITTLSNSFAHIEQTWRRNVPWPIKSDNGTVKSTLVKFERDGKAQYEREGN